MIYRYETLLLCLEILLWCFSCIFLVNRRKFEIIAIQYRYILRKTCCNIPILLVWPGKLCLSHVWRQIYSRPIGMYILSFIRTINNILLLNLWGGASLFSSCYFMYYTRIVSFICSVSGVLDFQTPPSHTTYYIHIIQIYSGGVVVCYCKNSQECKKLLLPMLLVIHSGFECSVICSLLVKMYFIWNIDRLNVRCVEIIFK